MEEEPEQDNLNSLIDDLAEDLEPVKGVMNPLALITPWIIVVVAYIVGVVHFLGIRMDWREKMAEAPFLFEMGMAGLIAVSAAYVAGWLAIPDMREKKWLLAIPVTLFGAFLFWVGCLAFVNGLSPAEFSWHSCFSDALLMAFVPIASLSLLVRRGATTKPLWLAFMSILSVGAIGWMSLRLTCPADDITHTLLFHFMPFVLLAAVMGALARRLYRW